MIGRLTGTLAARTPPEILLDVHGVGYELSVPMSTYYELPPLGSQVTLITHTGVRDDIPILYGFLTEAERSAFRELLRVGSIGPRSALAVLSGLSTEELASAIADQDPARLIRVPGIGKKTADRMLLELRGRLVPQLPGRGTPGAAAGASAAGATDAVGALGISPQQTEILRALQSLGFSDREGLAAVRKLPADTDVTGGIRAALRQLGRA